MKTLFSFVAWAGLAAVILSGCGGKGNSSGSQASGGISASGGSAAGGQSADLTASNGGDTGPGTPTGGAAGATGQEDAAAGTGGDSSSSGVGSIAGGAPMADVAGATSQGGSATGTADAGGVDGSATLKDAPGSGGRDGGAIQQDAPATTDASADVPGPADASAPLNCTLGNPTFAFAEGFESYPAGLLNGASGSPWIRANEGRDGIVSTTWVKTGAHNYRTDSYTISTQVEYVKLDFPTRPLQLVVELWYTPDGYYVYEDFAEFGLGWAASKFDLKPMIGVSGSDHSLLLAAPGVATTREVWNELDYGKSNGGSAVHNYVRLELDFCAGQISVFAGPDQGAPLRATVPFDGSQPINAFYISGGLNPTYFDDIAIWTPGTPHPDIPGAGGAGAGGQGGSATGGAGAGGAGAGGAGGAGGSVGGSGGAGGFGSPAARDASGVSDSDADGSSVGASLRLVQSFAGPGQSPQGIAWDGSHIWVSASATLFEMDTQGNLVNSISVGPGQGIVWDGAAFWHHDWTIAHFTIADNSYTTIGSFKSPATVSGGGINDDLAWDGQNLWLANQYKVFQLSTAGTVLSGTFSFAQNVAGLDWDGAHFWITYSSNGMRNKTVFAALDTSGRVINTFSSPVSDVEAISWGASDHLWGLSPDDPFATPRYYVYEIDASSAKASLPK